MSQKIQIYIPTFISDQNYNPNRVLPRLYFYNGTLDCEKWYVNQRGTGSVAVNEFPYFDHYNVITGSFPSTGSNSLLFNNETPVYGSQPNNTLYTDYWATYIGLLYNPKTRLLNASAIIPLAEYFKMELNDIVEFRSNYYHLRAINDYNLKTGECKIQLLGPIIPDTLSSGVFGCAFTFDSETVTTTTSTTTTAAPTTTTTAGPTTTTTTLTPTTTTTTSTTSTTTTAAPTTTTTTAGTTTTTTATPTTTTTTTLSPNAPYFRTLRATVDEFSFTFSSGSGGTGAESFVMQTSDDSINWIDLAGTSVSASSLTTWYLNEGSPFFAQQPGSSYGTGSYFRLKQINIGGSYFTSREVQRINQSYNYNVWVCSGSYGYTTAEGNQLRGGSVMNNTAQDCYQILGFADNEHPITGSFYNNNIFIGACGDPGNNSQRCNATKNVILKLDLIPNFDYTPSGPTTGSFYAGFAEKSGYQYTSGYVQLEKSSMTSGSIYSTSQSFNIGYTTGSTQINLGSNTFNGYYTASIYGDNTLIGTLTGSVSSSDFMYYVPNRLLFNNGDYNSITCSLLVKI